MVDNMPHRTPCTWRKDTNAILGSNICKTCLGYIVFKSIQYCPYHADSTPDPIIQHLLTADERYYNIQQLRKLEELRQ